MCICVYKPNLSCLFEQYIPVYTYIHVLMYICIYTYILILPPPRLQKLWQSTPEEDRSTCAFVVPRLPWIMRLRGQFAGVSLTETTKECFPYLAAYVQLAQGTSHSGRWASCMEGSRCKENLARLLMLLRFNTP